MTEKTYLVLGLDGEGHSYSTHLRINPELIGNPTEDLGAGKLAASQLYRESHLDATHLWLIDMLEGELVGDYHGPWDYSSLEPEDEEFLAELDEMARPKCDCGNKATRHLCISQLTRTSPLDEDGNQGTIVITENKRSFHLCESCQMPVISEE